MEPSAICTFRLLKKTAIVYLLLRYMDRPIGEVEIARILEIDRSTTRNHLRSLASMGLVTRLKRHEGYILTNAGRQMLLGEMEANPPKIKNMEEIPPSLIITTVNDSDIDTDSLTTEIKDGMGEIPPFEITPVWSALRKASIIRNHRTERLAMLPHITPDYITAHHLALQRAGKGKHPGLLISILESGEPAPALNANRHLSDCDCPDCQRIKHQLCWYCGQYPCICDEEEE